MSTQKKIDVTELGKTCEAIMTLKLKPNVKIHNCTSNQQIFP